MKITEYFDKNYLARWGASVLSGILALGLLVYLGYHFYDIISPDLELIDATPTSFTEVISAEGYIMRDEEPLYSDVTSGSVAPSIRDGGRIAIGANIADVYSLSSPDIEARLSEIEEQLAFLRKTSESSHIKQSVSGVDGRIYENIFTIRSYIASGDYSDALSMRTTLLANITEKAISSGQTDYSSMISSLESEKANLKSRLGTNLMTKYATSTGYYFSEYDGYGEIFSSDKIDSLTYDEFIKLTYAEPEVSSSGLCLGVCVKDFYWYIACEMSKSEAASLLEKYSCDILFTYSDTEVECELYRVISETPGDRAVAVFRCETLVDGFDYTRVQPIKISAAEYTGYEIPSDAVRVVGGFEGVYILDEITVEFRRINIVYRGEDSVICTGRDETKPLTADDEAYPWLKQNDIIVTNGRDLYSGKIIG